MTFSKLFAAAAILGMAYAGTTQAQTGQALSAPGCSQAPVAAATPPATGDGSGTAPGGSGSTGWSGSGLGGSYTGTSQAGPVGSSPSFHPVTAKGLDPIKGMGKPNPTC